MKKVSSLGPKPPLRQMKFDVLLLRLQNFLVPFLKPYKVS